MITCAGPAFKPASPRIADPPCVVNLSVATGMEPCRSHRYHRSSRGACHPYPLTRYRRGIPPAFAASCFSRVGSK